MSMVSKSALAGAILLAGPALAQTAQQKNDQPTMMDKVKQATESVTGNPLSKLDPDMRHVIDALTSLHPSSIVNLSAQDARKQPSAADAAAKVLREQGQNTLPDPDVKTTNILVDGANGRISATVYTPANASGPLPVIVYFHGGGFVIANNATYSASASMLAKKVNAVVVSPEYSKAPEHKFPASHDDAIAAYKWITQNASSLGGDPKKIALAGESAGGNLTVNVAIAARDQNLPKPLYEVIVYPMAGTNFDTASYKMADSSFVSPLNSPMMHWFYNTLAKSPSDLQDPRLDIVGKADLKGLPPATVITSQIDPLQSEGQALAEKMKTAGVRVDYRNFDGVTHEFFGMGAVVGKAREAEDMAVKNLKAAFNQGS